MRCRPEIFHRRARDQRAAIAGKGAGAGAAAGVPPSFSPSPPSLPYGPSQEQYIRKWRRRIEEKKWWRKAGRERSLSSVRRSSGRPSRPPPPPPAAPAPSGARGGTAPPEVTMAVNLVMIVIGFSMMAHAGYGLMEESRAATLASQEGIAISSQIFLEVVIGAVVALWGGIDDFKPILMSDSKKTGWETQHLREEMASIATEAGQGFSG
ncbi:unnamed protein product [Prorocentrum cordatum]|uniref:Membrane magnesium transporter n=1 Tax=Prorocentrum cordatum TaxID=2364126 RepID=A0ABN9WN67_9DINO|nr:unnamed protein product [Polarella glacialis]